MDQLVNGNNLLIDTASLIVALVRHLVNEGGANFYLCLIAGVFLATVTCFLIRLVVINVNRDYNSGFGFFAGCILAACTTFFTVVVVVSLQYVDPVVRVAIKGWESTLQRDHSWSNATFRNAYEAVYALKDSNGKKLENFTNYPHPDKGGTIIPMNSDESKLKAITVYLDRSVEHFDKNMPFLSWILWANSGMAKENIYQDMKRVFTTNPTYQMSDAISIAGKEIAKILSGQTKRIIWFGRIISLTVFSLIQMVIIGLLVLSAHRYIRENL